MPEKITFGTFDRGARGSARFLTTIEMTGGDPADMPITAMYRLACYYMLGHFGQAALLHACHSLSDIYLWQIEQEQAPTPPQIDKKKVASGPLVRSVERQPFVISD